MKLTISCIENGGFTGEYPLPGFGCILRVNADGYNVTIDVVDEEEDRIKREIAEEREELSKGTVEEDLGDFLEEDKERNEEFQVHVMEEPWDITGVYDYEDLVNEKGEYLLEDFWKGTQYEKEVGGLNTYHIENHEDEDKDDDIDIENTFEYEFVKSVQETDESGVVLRFLEQLLNDLDVHKTDVNGNIRLMNLLKGLSDYISELDVKK